jgi:predicted esterase
MLASIAARASSRQAFGDIVARMLDRPRTGLATLTLTLAFPLMLASGCADEPGLDDEAGSSESESSGATGGSESAGASETSLGDSDGSSESETGEPPPMLPLCGSEPPDGATLAPPLPSATSSCPVLETDGTLNVMSTSAGEREFMVVVPSDYEAGEQLPLIVMYHWLGGDAIDFYERAEAQVAADYYRFIALVPVGRDGDSGVPFRWPFSIADDMMRMDEEFEFFDDMVACAHEQFGVDKECVSAMGVSAGAMFSAMLASRHGDNLSSFISLSGGTGGGLIQEWVPNQNHMPALVLWGGPQDICLSIEFDLNSMTMEAALAADNHFMVECIHNCEHSTPPFEPVDPALPTYAPMWEFFLDHPYWLDDGDSPYLHMSAPPASWPDWCAIGPGNAIMRVGECGGSEC